MKKTFLLGLTLLLSLMLSGCLSTSQEHFHNYLNSVNKEGEEYCLKKTKAKSITDTKYISCFFQYKVKNYNNTKEVLSSGVDAIENSWLRKDSSYYGKYNGEIKVPNDRTEPYIMQQKL